MAQAITANRQLLGLRISGIAFVVVLHGWLIASFAALISPVIAAASGNKSPAISIRFGSVKTPPKSATMKLLTTIRPHDERPKSELTTKPALMESLTTTKPHADTSKKITDNSDPSRNHRQTSNKSAAVANSTHHSDRLQKIMLTNSQATKSRDAPPLIITPVFAQPPAPPRYPTIARKRGQQGTVWLDIWLDENGQQAKLVLAQSSGSTVLDQAAITAVRKWRFNAYKVGNRYQASRLHIPVEFLLN